MKKVMILAAILTLVICGQAYANYSFDFMSDNGDYGFTGTFDTTSNGNGPLLVTGASLTGDGILNTGTSYSYALLAPLLTAQNSDGAGANLSGADNLVYPGSNTIFNPSDPNNGMIFVQSAGLNPIVVNGSVNSSTDNVPAIGIWAIGPGTYEYWQSWTSTGSGSATASLSPVPEPCTMLLIGSGLIGLAAFKKKLKNA